MRRTYDHEEKILQDPFSATALAIGLAGQASGYFTGEKQREAQKEAQKKQEFAELQARKIAAERKPEDEEANLELLTGDNAQTKGIEDLVVAPTKKKSQLGISGTAGLGFGSRL